MANKIYLPNDNQAMSNTDLTKYWNESGYNGDYDTNRIEGAMCNCNGDGEFELLARDSEAVLEGGKDYMQCRKCGEFSHL